MYRGNRSVAPGAGTDCGENIMNLGQGQVTPCTDPLIPLSINALVWTEDATVCGYELLSLTAAMLRIQQTISLYCRAFMTDVESKKSWIKSCFKMSAHPAPPHASGCGVPIMTYLFLPRLAPDILSACMWSRGAPVPEHLWASCMSLRGMLTLY